MKHRPDLENIEDIIDRGTDDDGSEVPEHMRHIGDLVNKDGVKGWTCIGCGSIRWGVESRDAHECSWLKKKRERKHGMDEKTKEKIERILDDFPYLLISEDAGDVEYAAIKSRSGETVFIVPTIKDHQEYVLEFADSVPDWLDNNLKEI